jgi:hypothetical protein
MKLRYAEILMHVYLLPIQIHESVANEHSTNFQVLGIE